ncbi:MAG: FAD-binding oxidoreductase [Candidatus Rokubacteria bacterium]|nr:FAD-binding oxidoreductase [Candidatus Rokubacteria bacterium]
MARVAAEVVICGAGIAGIATAYHLAVRHGVDRVLLVDERPPLSLTSDKSTEAYRNWWPGPDAAMLRLMNRSLDLLEALAEETGNVFRMNRRGYVYATADPAHAVELAGAAETAAAMGAGPLRRHPGSGAPYQPAPAFEYRGQPTGADLLLDPAAIRRHFPYVAPDAVAVLHARRCGWLSGQQLGMHLLERARQAGVRLLDARVEAIETAGGRVTGVRVTGPAGAATLATGRFVDAAGPFVGDVARLLGVDLPVFCERHLKMAFDDHLGVVPRDAPFLIWDDPQGLDWSEEERAGLAASDELRWMLEPFPAGVHLRPEGNSPDSRTLLVLWAYHVAPGRPLFPLPPDPLFPELALRGMARMIPGLGAYLARMPRAQVDGGYYTKTRENRPLVGPLPVDGAYVIGALSGYGLMAACAAGELAAAHVAGGALPDYAPAFALARYDDPEYRTRLLAWGSTGQL